jgi:hypothetical protein
MDNHVVNGRPCKDPSCWCNIFPAGLKTKSEFTWEPEDIAQDVVNNPEHYKLQGLEVEALDVIKSVLSYDEYIGYLRGNILKYQLRAGKKTSKEEDLGKANYYTKELEEYMNVST